MEERSPVASRTSGQSVKKGVTTTSPVLPSGRGSPVAGSQISTWRQFDKCIPPSSMHSQAMHPTSAVPYPWRTVMPNIASTSRLSDSGRGSAATQAFSSRKSFFQIIPGGLGLEPDDLEVAGHAHERGHRQPGQELDLLLRVARPGRDDRAPDIPERFLEHQSGGRHVIGEGHLRQIPGPEPGGKEPLGPGPVVRPIPLGVEDRPRRLVDARKLPRLAVEEPGQPVLLLHGDDIPLAKRRNLPVIPEVLEVARTRTQRLQTVLELARMFGGGVKHLLHTLPLPLHPLLTRLGFIFAIVHG
eukprot:TRINITY_DN6372_c0_g1_i2.p2 TRINITY_DN6372_c0_g1~~TRINITY_DN6372_c0_g1_i2.p2  ORF type:complete len:300 (-),score=73.27 TRINITY_DN6372_c0_g1_i2:1490-2389(-)